MNLTSEQLTAAIEAMARAMCKNDGDDPDRLGDLVLLPRWKFQRSAAKVALYAALPIIEAALASDKPGGDNG